MKCRGALLCAVLCAVLLRCTALRCAALRCCDTPPSEQCLVCGADVTSLSRLSARYLDISLRCRHVSAVGGGHMLALLQLLLWLIFVNGVQGSLALQKGPAHLFLQQLRIYGSVGLSALY